MTSHFHSSILLCCLKSIPNFTLYFASSNIWTLSPCILKSIRVPNFDQTVGWRSSGHMAYHKSNTGPKSIEVCTSVYYCWLGFPTIQNYRVGHDFSFWRVWRVYFQLRKSLYYHDYCHNYQIVLLQSHIFELHHTIHNLHNFLIFGTLPLTHLSLQIPLNFFHRLCFVEFYLCV